jgi:hypothetical protein
MFAMVVWGGFRVKEEGKGGRGVQDDTLILVLRYVLRVRLSWMMMQLCSSHLEMGLVGVTRCLTTAVPGQPHLDYTEKP